LQIIDGDPKNELLGKECGPNTFPSFFDANAPQTLRDWGKDLAIEGGVVKAGDCDGTGYKAAALRAIARVRDCGGSVRYYCVDESLEADRAHCKGGVDVVAETLADFIKTLRTEGTDVGLIEGYPGRGNAGGAKKKASDIQTLLEKLTEKDAKPAFLHMDVDRLEFPHKTQRIPTNPVKDDLWRLFSFCQENQIKFGVIIWGNNPKDDLSYQKDALILVDNLKAMGLDKIDRLIVQSWDDRQKPEEHGQNPQRHIPNALPEHQPGTLTALLLETKRRIEGGSAPSTKNVLMELFNQYFKRTS